MRFEGKVAIVTGGGSGIGFAGAKRMLEEEATVVIADVDEAAGVKAVERLEADDLGRVEAIATDASDSTAVQALVTAVMERHGRIDVLFNNAGFFKPGKVHEVDEAEWERTMAVNLRSAFLMSKYVVPHMLAQGGGAIVNNASVAAIVGDVASAAYCATKGGVALLTKAMALDYANEGIRVNAICCGEIDTPMFEREAGQLGLTVDEYRAVLSEAHPIGRIGRPEEVAAAVAFLAADETSFITGILLPVDGGYSAA